MDTVVYEALIQANAFPGITPALHGSVWLLGQRYELPQGHLPSLVVKSQTPRDYLIG